MKLAEAGIEGHLSWTFTSFIEIIVNLKPQPVTEMISLIYLYLIYLLIFSITQYLWTKVQWVNVLLEINQIRSFLSQPSKFWYDSIRFIEQESKSVRESVDQNNQFNKEQILLTGMGYEPIITYFINKH